MKTRIPGMAAVLALSCAAALAVAPGVVPVQAELITDMQARLLKVGSTVYARVTVDWRDTTCILNKGAILEGHVLSVVPHIKPAKGSEVSLDFSRAQCGEQQMTAFKLLLVALAAPPQNNDLGVLTDSFPVSTRGEGGVASLNSMRVGVNFNFQLEEPVFQFPQVKNMRMGYVSGIHGLKLDVGAGQDNSSVMTSKDHDVSLEKHTLLLLVPSQGTFPIATAGSGTVRPVSADTSRAGVSSTPDVSAHPVQPADDIDLCAPPQCSEALPSGDATDVGNATASISINQLGYAPRSQRQMNSFDHDETLAYLGSRELLVAFNPHKLLTRHTLGRSESTVRVIRAAVVDTATHQVTHTVDWELPDNRQYLWPLAEGRVLVHVGSELRVYGEGLKIENRISLDGPLAFVRVTPDGSFLALGVIHERHAPELHAQLRENVEGEPEEDINILVLNRKFETIGKSTARSGLMEPTLLNEGQAKLQALPNMRYRISMLAWDNQTKIVTRFDSSCTPELSSIAPDLIFLVSCDKQSQGREYRVLRPDGKLVLKGNSTLNELGHAAAGIADHDAFVVKTVQSTLPAAPGVIFRADQFSSEELHVYRATDGKRLFGVRVGSPSSSRDGYALSPNGSQLAVLTRDEIAIYSIGGK
jgi:hypothetical protein